MSGDGSAGQIIPRITASGDQIIQKMTAGEPIAILGAGAWGTALAILLANNHQAVRLWGHDANHIQQMVREKTNARYLPGIPLPKTIQLSNNLSETLADINDVLLVVPSRVFVEVLTQIKPYLPSSARIAWGTKGFTADRELLHIVAARVLEKPYPLAVLSGPSFAVEVAHGLPTAITVASTDATFSQSLSTRLNSTCFRAYTSDDITGVEVCGVIKNILAIAAGIIDGLQLGANALSALITRGLVEMKRFGIALGGKPDTFNGLAGLGDLVLTCTSNQSRNRRFGCAIAEGKKIEDITSGTVEGYYNLATVYQLTKTLKMSMPITEQIYQVIYENKSPKIAIQDLFARTPKDEINELVT